MASIHAKGSCQPATKDGVKASAAESAGGHLDPQNTGKHEGPEGAGHLGDLPALVVNNDGKATDAVIAPRLKSLDEIKDKALMVHAGGDNMSDQPKPLGGGGERYACGVIKQLRGQRTLRWCLPAAKASSTAARQLPPAHGRQVDDDGQGCRKSAVILQVWPPVIFAERHAHSSLPATVKYSYPGYS